MSLEEAKPTTRQHRRVPLLGCACSVIGFGGLALCVTIFLLAFVFSLKTFKVAGDAMAPAVVDGDFLLITRLVNGIERGDIVVFYNPQKPTLSYIMRVIALPGDTIRMDGKGQLYVNNQLTREPYALASSSQSTDIVPERTMSAGEYWIMGDNRDHSSDSRYLGPVPAKLIYGKALWHYWPPTRIGAVK